MNHWMIGLVERDVEGITWYAVVMRTQAGETMAMGPWRTTDGIAEHHHDDVVAAYRITHPVMESPCPGYPECESCRSSVEAFDSHTKSHLDALQSRLN